MTSLYNGDALTILKDLPTGRARCCVTSPPYWRLRSYLADDDPAKPLELGLEPSPEAYTERLVSIFREVRRVLSDDGTLWLNLGDCYATAGGSGFQGKESVRAHRRFTQESLRHRKSTPGLKPKNLVGIPWRVAFALQADGWFLRSDIVWSKTNPSPENVLDRPTNSHEYVFLLSKRPRYFYNGRAMREPLASGPSDLRKIAESKPRIGGLTREQTDPLMRGSALTNLGRKRAVGSLAGRNMRSVWTTATTPFPGPHFATFPEELARRCILAGSVEGDTVLDPFAGAGTTGVVALKAARHFVGIELHPDHYALIERRLFPALRQLRAL